VIPALPNWSWLFVDGEVLLAPPEGPRAGMIRYRERCRPLLRAARLAALDVDPDFTPARTSAPERRVTDEGEYAALIVQDGHADGAPAQRLLGYVFGDDYYARLAATVRAVEQAPRFRDVVEALLAADAHALGVRRRRFIYRGPEGWQGRNLDTFHAAWFSPEASDSSRMTIFPAQPLAAGAGLAGLEVLAHEPTRDFAPDMQMGPFRARRGALSKTRYEVTGSSGGHPRARDVLLLQDQRYVYPLVVDSPPSFAARNRALLEEVAATVEPLPTPGGGGALGQAVDHWM
jgi:hypothetical protein